MNSNIKFLDKLLQGVKVDWKTLGEIFDILAGHPED